MSVTVVRPDLMESAIRIDLAQGRPTRVRSLRGPVTRQVQPTRTTRPSQPDVPAPQLARHTPVAVAAEPAVPMRAEWRLTDRARALIAGLFAAVTLAGFGVLVGAFVSVSDAPTGGAESSVLAGQGA